MDSNSGIPDQSICFNENLNEIRVVHAVPDNASASALDSAAFEVYVSKDTFKFNAAHFVAFPGYRERLHGHNYRVGVRLLGRSQIGPDGYLIDFGCIKDACKDVCKMLNEHFLCPIYSDVLTITTNTPELMENKASGDALSTVRIECQDGSVFVFPRSDCYLLPIVHATTEELSIYLWAEILQRLNAGYLLQRGIHTMVITVEESPGQESTFRLLIPESARNGDFKLDVRSFVTKGNVVPMPCATEKASKDMLCCPNCASSKQLEKLANTINEATIGSSKKLTSDDLRAFIQTSNS